MANQNPGLRPETFNIDLDQAWFDRWMPGTNAAQYIAGIDFYQNEIMPDGTQRIIDTRQDNSIVYQINDELMNQPIRLRARGYGRTQALRQQTVQSMIRGEWMWQNRGPSAPIIVGDPGPIEITDNQFYTTNPEDTTITWTTDNEQVWIVPDDLAEQEERFWDRLARQDRGRSDVFGSPIFQTYIENNPDNMEQIRHEGNTLTINASGDTPLGLVLLEYTKQSAKRLFDVAENNAEDLINGAMFLMTEDDKYWPPHWGAEYKTELLSKPVPQKMAIASALLMSEIGRLKKMRE